MNTACCNFDLVAGFQRSGNMPFQKTGAFAANGNYLEKRKEISLRLKNKKRTSAVTTRGLL